MSKAADRNQRQLLELLKSPGNANCADCGSRNPRWASWDHGIFICVQCAGIHRKMGTHISKVKSLTLDTWSREQLDHMKARGNTVSNAELNPGSSHQPPPSSADEGERESQLEKFIRGKYEYRTFVGAAPPRRAAPPAAAAAPAPTPSAALARPPSPVSRRGPSPTRAQPAPPQPTRSSSTPLGSTLAFADEPSPTIPPRPAASTSKHPAPSPDLASSSVKHVRFRSLSVSIPDAEEQPLRVPSAAGYKPAKGILRPFSASASVIPLSGAEDEWKGMEWAMPGKAAPSGSGLGLGSPNGAAEMQSQTPSFGSTMGPQSGQGSAMTYGGLPPALNYGGTTAFRATAATPLFQQQTGFAQPSRPFSAPPSVAITAAVPTPAPPPPRQPERYNSSIWDDLDDLGGLSPPAPAPAPRASTPNFAYPPGHRSASPFGAPSPNPQAPLRPQLTGFVPSSQFGQDLERNASPSLFGPPSPNPPPPAPAPLRPQLTGFVPSSHFGQELQRTASPSLFGGAPAPSPSFHSSPAPPAVGPLRPQLTGFVPSSQFGREMASELPGSSPGGQAEASSAFLRPQQTGFGAPPSSAGSPFGQQQQQQQQGSFFPPAQQPRHQQQVQPQPSPSSFYPPQAQRTPSPLRPVSTNPFHSSMLAPASFGGGGGGGGGGGAMGNMSSMAGALPQQQPAGGTNPFFAAPNFGGAGLQPQATGMGMGGGGMYGAPAQQQLQSTPTGGGQFAQTNPFFGYGQQQQVGQQQAQQGQFGYGGGAGRAWGT